MTEAERLREVLEKLEGYCLDAAVVSFGEARDVYLAVLAEMHRLDNETYQPNRSTVNSPEIPDSCGEAK